MNSAVIGLSVLLVFLVFRISRQIYQTYRCLDEGTLRDFWFGRLNNRAEEKRRVISHLGHCEQCREKLYRIQKGISIEDHLVDDRNGKE